MICTFMIWHVHTPTADLHISTYVIPTLTYLSNTFRLLHIIP